MNMYQWNQQLSELQQITYQQREQIKLLEEKVQRLEEQIQGKSGTTVEKIEYHFDQLKIERLDGTLHIGLSPNELANIDDLAFPNLKKQPTQQPVNPKLTTAINQFVNKEGPQMIRSLSEKYNRPIDHRLEGDIIHDMLSQIPDRIAFYEKEAKEKHEINSPQQLEEYIFSHIKKEVYISLQRFMENNNKQEEED